MASFGGTIKLQGESEYRKALKTITQNLKEVSSEIKVVTSAYDKSDSSVEALTKKKEVLNKKLDEQKAKVQILEKALDEANATVQESSKKHEELTRKYNDEKSKLDSLGSTLGVTSKEYLEQQKVVEELGSQLQSSAKEQEGFATSLSNMRVDLNNATSEMQKTSRELESIEKAFEDAGDGAKDFTEEVEDSGREARDSGEGFTIMKGALADLVSKVVQNAIAKIGALTSELMGLSEETEEYRTMSAKLEASAKNYGYSLDYVTDKQKELYGYLGDDQASTNAITNLMGLNASTEDLTKLLDGAIGVWASYGDSIPIESLTESINETITAGKVTGTFADTINWNANAQEQLYKSLEGNKKAQKAFNKSIKEGESAEDAYSKALASITDEQKRAEVVSKYLNDAYGESKTTYDGLTESIRGANEAEAELKETQAKLGKTLEPVNTALTNLKTKALESLVPVIENICEWLSDFGEYLKENEGVAKALTGGAIALATAFGVLAGALAIQGLISGVTKAVALLNTTLLANPIVLIVTAIAGLVAGLIYAYNECEAFRKIVDEVFQAIWDTVKPIVDSIVNAFQQAWELIKVVWDLVQPYFSAIWEAIQNVFSRVVEVLGGYFEMAWTYIKFIWDTVIGYFRTIWDTIAGIFSVVKDVLTGNWQGAWDGIKGIVGKWKDYFVGIWNGIKGVFGKVGDFFGTVFGGAWDKVKKIFSTGGQIFMGIVDGIKNAFTNIVNKIIDGINKVVAIPFNGINTALRKIRDVNILGVEPFKGLIKLIDVPQIPRLEKGGIVDKETLATIGENGKEAIVPLEHNTEWIRNVANEINKSNGAPANYDYYVNAFKEALKDVKVVMNDREMGTFVADTMERVVYS